MARKASNGFFDRAVTIHRHDCVALAEVESTPSAEALPGISEISGNFESERIGAYAVEARASYEGLRRLVGQLAGFLILARVSGRQDLLDLPELKAARERWLELRQIIRTLTPSGPLAAHKTRLSQSHELSGKVLCQIDMISNPDERDNALDQAGELIKLAYKALQSTSDERAGLMMVDFTQACCSCSPLR